MQIPHFFGLQKTSLVDFPGKIAPVIFFPGCNLRCPYCHNPDLALGRTYGLMNSEDIFDFLKLRAPLLGGIVLSGGEPLLYPGIPDFIHKIKTLTNLPVKIDTNGLNPNALSHLDEVDYIAMDLKVLPESYPLLGGTDDSHSRIMESVQILQSGSFDYEFRTTIVPDLIPLKDVAELSSIIKKSRHFITGFKPGNCLDYTYNKIPSVNSETLKKYLFEFHKMGCLTKIR